MCPTPSKKRRNKSKNQTEKAALGANEKKVNGL